MIIKGLFAQVLQFVFRNIEHLTSVITSYPFYLLRCCVSNLQIQRSLLKTIQEETFYAYADIRFRLACQSSLWFTYYLDSIIYTWKKVREHQRFQMVFFLLDSENHKTID